MFIKRMKEKFKCNEPIFTTEIMVLFMEYSHAYVFRLIDKALKKGELIKFEAGVYYIPEKSIIGKSTITTEDVARKRYISYNNFIYGIYSGLMLINLFSITSQVPNTIEIVTNNETTRKREISIDGRTVILRKSRCKITKDNASAYTILQLFTDIDKETKLSASAKNNIINYMKSNKVKDEDLFALSKYFPAKTMKNLLMSGVLYDIA